MIPERWVLTDLWLNCFAWVLLCLCVIDGGRPPLERLCLSKLQIHCCSSAASSHLYRESSVTSIRSQCLQHSEGLNVGFIPPINPPGRDSALQLWPLPPILTTIRRETAAPSLHWAALSQQVERWPLRGNLHFLPSCKQISAAQFSQSPQWRWGQELLCGMKMTKLKASWT